MRSAHGLRNLDVNFSGLFWLPGAHEVMKIHDKWK